MMPMTFRNVKNLVEYHPLIQYDTRQGGQWRASGRIYANAANTAAATGHAVAGLFMGYKLRLVNWDVDASESITPQSALHVQVDSLRRISPDRDPPVRAIPCPP